MSTDIKILIRPLFTEKMSRLEDDRNIFSSVYESEQVRN